MPPDYGEVPFPPMPEEASVEQRADRARKREAAEQAFRETLKTGVKLNLDFRRRYEKTLGKTRVVELIREFEAPGLFDQN